MAIQQKTRNVLLILIGLVLLFELFRDAGHTGDFIGYVNAGNAVLTGKDIYSDYLNTWPPFFSVFSVVLAWGDSISPYFIRFLWLAGSIIAMYYIMRITIQMTLGKTLGFIGIGGDIQLQNQVVLIPLLISLRFIMDNLANVQINIYLLLAAIVSISLFTKKQFLWAGLLLGLTIALKVYTIFLLFYFLFKREYKMVFWTSFFVLLFSSFSFIVFGYEQTIAYYVEWITEIAPRSFHAHHKNQSIFGMFLRLFTAADPGNGFYINIFHLNQHFVKLMTYVIVALVAVFPIYSFRKKLKNPSSLQAFLEYSFVLTAIPVLSPIAWKAYFIFLWVPYFLLYWLLFLTDNKLKKGLLKKLKFLFWTSVVLTVFSTEAFVGGWFSDILENFSVITIGTILLLVIQIIVYRLVNYE